MRMEAGAHGQTQGAAGAAASELACMLRDLEALVEVESPSDDKAAVARSASTVARVGEAHLGVAPELIDHDSWTHVRWRLGPDRKPGVLLLGHHDTVWPFGSLASRPFSVEGDVARGPGCFDMLAGLAQMFHVSRALGAGVPHTLLVTGDEELGSPSSRALIEAEAVRHLATLVFEPSAEGGHLKLGRKGVARYHVHIRGRAAHAGLEPERGVNATLELAAHAQWLASLSRAEIGTSVTPTTARSGTSSNTVPATAHLSVDVRARTLAELARVDQAVSARRPVLPGAEVTFVGGLDRPPLEESMSGGLFQLAREAATAVGMGELEGSSVGGASDGNLTAAAGCPTLDGLGAVGGGAHADDEHVDVSQMVPRTALATEIARRVLDDVDR